MSKKLVAYFSASGVTTGVAKALAEAVGADLAVRTLRSIKNLPLIQNALMKQQRHGSPLFWRGSLA